MRSISKYILICLIWRFWPRRELFRSSSGLSCCHVMLFGLTPRSVIGRTTHAWRLITWLCSFPFGVVLWSWCMTLDCYVNLGFILYCTFSYKRKSSCVVSWGCSAPSCDSCASYSVGQDRSDWSFSLFSLWTCPTCAQLSHVIILADTDITTGWTRRLCRLPFFVRQ